MSLRTRGDHRYGDSAADLPTAITRYAKGSYRPHHFAHAVCTCGGQVFKVQLDDTAGAAVRLCVACRKRHAIGDSAEFLEGAELDDCACPCGNEELEVAVGVSLYRGSEDVRWLYLGCRCPKCGITEVYGDWKNEFIGYQALLARV